MHIDHRKLGRELDLFDADPLIGAGLPFWLPDGAAARHEIESYLYALERRAGYRHVHSPALGKRQMYELSGHRANFADDMFPAMALGEDLVLRPSLCPHHALIFKARPRSHRDLPLRLGELGPMYRAERSGVLGGLARVRAIQLNDAHIFCAREQAGAEVTAALRLMGKAHAALGVRPSGYRLSMRGAAAKYAGDDASWEWSAGLLRAALDQAGLPYREVEGEAAFYGPKIDVQVADPAGRESTLATVQVDAYQPERFDLGYHDADGRRSRPVMVHRSLVGSMERLFAHLIEVHAGAFPVWYAPVQLAVVPVGADQARAADAVHADALAAGVRVSVDHEGSVGARIRLAAQRKVPYVAVLGAREAERDEVSLRLRDGRQVAAMPVAQAVALIAAVVAERSPDLLPGRSA